MEPNSTRDCLTCERQTPHYNETCLQCTEKHFFVLFHVPAWWDEKEMLETMIQDFYDMNSTRFDTDIRAQILEGVEVK